MKRIDQVIVGSILALVIALVWIVAGTLEPPVITAGDTALDFKVTTAQGRIISPSQFEGKLLVLNLWATWCEGCVKELQSLVAFHQEFASQGVVVLGVSMDRNEARYRHFLRQFQVGFETTRDQDWNISGDFGTFKLPETYIINSSGKVVQKIVDTYDFMDPDFVAGIRKLL